MAKLALIMTLKFENFALFAEKIIIKVFFKI